MKRKVHTELCVICCSINQIPKTILGFTLELRKQFPATVLTLAKTGVLFGFWKGRDVCWNCCGTGEVEVNVKKI